MSCLLDAPMYQTGSVYLHNVLADGNIDFYPFIPETCQFILVQIKAEAAVKVKANVFI